MIAGQTEGAVRIMLQLEGAAIAGIAIWAYGQAGAGWLLFALLFLVPDLAMLGYLGGARIGSWTYNVAHSYTGPVLLAALGWVLGAGLAWPVALIWAAHIGVDRTLGYGLKYPAGFKVTHLSAQF